jgi:hypothetical protein
MKWMRTGEKDWGLLVSPLHGRGNKNAEGAGVKTLLYRVPKDVRGEWKSEVLEETLHATHNIELSRQKTGAQSALIGGREGVIHLRAKEGAWDRQQIIKNDGTPEGSVGVGELRGLLLDSGREMLATIEPMHGNHLVVYRVQGASGGKPDRKVLTDQLNEGHALATGDLVGGKGTEIVVGFRGNPGKPRPIGIRVWTALDEEGKEWRETVVDDQNMATEDLVLADLDADGDLDIVASGRASKNIAIYWNETER